MLTSRVVYGSGSHFTVVYRISLPFWFYWFICSCECTLQYSQLSNSTVMEGARTAYIVLRTEYSII